MHKQEVRERNIQQTIWNTSEANTNLTMVNNKQTHTRNDPEHSGFHKHFNRYNNQPSSEYNQLKCILILSPGVYQNGTVLL